MSGPERRSCDLRDSSSDCPTPHDVALRAITTACSGKRSAAKRSVQMQLKINHSKPPHQQEGFSHSKPRHYQKLIETQKPVHKQNGFSHNKLLHQREDFSISMPRHQLKIYPDSNHYNSKRVSATANPTRPAGGIQPQPAYHFTRQRDSTTASDNTNRSEEISHRKPLHQQEGFSNSKPML